MMASIFSCTRSIRDSLILATTCIFSGFGSRHRLTFAHQSAFFDQRLARTIRVVGVHHLALGRRSDDTLGDLFFDLFELRDFEL